jgi:hypothetical protein
VVYKSGTIEHIVFPFNNNHLNYHSAPHTKSSNTLSTIKMAKPALSTTAPLSTWVENVVKVAFVEQDDAVAAESFEQLFSPDFIAM